MLPFVLRFLEFGLHIEITLFRTVHLLVQPFQYGFLLLRWSCDERFFISKVVDKSLFRNVVEVGEKLIELLLSDRVILMVMTARTSDGQPQPDGRGCFHTVGDILHAKLLRDDTTLCIGSMISMKPGRDLLIA